MDSSWMALLGTGIVWSVVTWQKVRWTPGVYSLLTKPGYMLSWWIQHRVGFMRINVTEFGSYVQCCLWGKVPALVNSSTLLWGGQIDKSIQPSCFSNMKVKINNSICCLIPSQEVFFLKKLPKNFYSLNTLSSDINK